jgi:hypothetical protein
MLEAPAAATATYDTTAGAFRTPGIQPFSAACRDYVFYCHSDFSLNILLHEMAEETREGGEKHTRCGPLLSLSGREWFRGYLTLPRPAAREHDVTTCEGAREQASQRDHHHHLSTTTTTTIIIITIIIINHPPPPPPPHHHLLLIILLLLVMISSVLTARQ